MNGRLLPAELDRRLADLSADRSQELAKLLAGSGWTHEELAERTGRSRPWVTRHILYGRFLIIVPNGTDISEGSFHSLWGRTDKAGSDKARFDEVFHLAQETREQRKAQPSKALADRIMARVADGKWHALDAVAEKLDAPRAVLDVTLNTLERAPHHAKLEYKTVGIRPHCRIFRADRTIPLSELKTKFGPIIEELKQQGKTNAATVSIGAVNHCAHRLQQIIDDWSA